ncbi:methionine--tRNA ligase [Candidatus Sumerlaeota bacterium]|nr:methionine--tRNA ligase [Candidatus Sumerlaeota bacterium]
MAEKFYITTPLYYVNDIPHLGHIFEVIGIDVLARFRRMQGYKVFFMTGTDEHGLKNQKEAERRGVSPQEFVDQMSEMFKSIWQQAEISYDYFIRTTEPRHVKAVIKFFNAVRDNGDIYKGFYEGWYCTPCETFWSESQLTDGNVCPECKRPITRHREEAYFFKLSKYQNWLMEHIKSNADFIKPSFRANEMINSFIKPGLNDLCISRTTVKWGIPVPGDNQHVIYVWFDALINYVSGIGYADDEEQFKEFWPADCHVVGKDILKFHTAIWPAMLKAAGLEPPRQVFGHGFVTIKEEKMSKSKGNIIDPREYFNTYGTDALRYFLLREISYAMDGVFSEEKFKQRYNADLANDLGNLLNRTMAMIRKYNQGRIIRKGDGLSASEQEIIASFGALFQSYETRMPEFEYNVILAQTWDVINLLNKYINDKQPWLLAKDSSRRNELETVLYTVAEGLRSLGSLLYPFMPATAERIWQQLGIEQNIPEVAWSEHRRWGWLPDGTQLREPSPLFPRIE